LVGVFAGLERIEPAASIGLCPAIAIQKDHRYYYYFLSYEYE
jgi:hypothetical protein